MGIGHQCVFSSQLIFNMHKRVPTYFADCVHRQKMPIFKVLHSDSAYALQSADDIYWPFLDCFNDFVLSYTHPAYFCCGVILWHFTAIQHFWCTFKLTFSRFLCVIKARSNSFDISCFVYGNFHWDSCRMQFVYNH